jgi:hypothetical protein
MRPRADRCSPILQPQAAMKAFQAPQTPHRNSCPAPGHLGIQHNSFDAGRLIVKERWQMRALFEDWFGLDLEY